MNEVNKVNSQRSHHLVETRSTTCVKIIVLVAGLGLIGFGIYSNQGVHALLPITLGGTFVLGSILWIALNRLKPKKILDEPVPEKKDVVALESRDMQQRNDVGILLRQFLLPPVTNIVLDYVCKPFTIWDWSSLNLPNYQEIFPKSLCLPQEMLAYLGTSCPFWQGKKVFETHFVYLRPSRGLIPLLLKHFTQEPYQKFTVLESNDEPYNADNLLYEEVFSKPCWVVMTKQIIPRSLNKNWANFGLKLSELEYEVLPTYEMVLGILALSCADLNHRPFVIAENQQTWAFTRKNAQRRIGFENSESSVLRLTNGTDNNSTDPSTGLAVARKFIF